MDRFSNGEALSHDYRDEFSFRHHSRGRRHNSGQSQRETAQPPTQQQEGLNGSIVDETGRHSIRFQGHCSHKYCSPDPYENHNIILNNGHIRTGPFCHEKGQSIDASSVIANKMAALYGDQDLSDIQIMVGHTVFYVHKLVLCCSSDVLRVMLTNPQWPESQRSKVVLKEEPECVAVFPAFIQYLYTGIIHLNHDTVMPLLMLADKYNVKDLREVCSNYMSSHLVSVVHRSRAVSWLQYAQLCAHNELAFACAEFIRLNFHKVSSSSDFLLLEKENLMHFLEDTELVVPDELTTFKAVLRWLKHQEEKLMGQTNAFHHLVLEVFSSIRFPQMDLNQLRQLELDARGMECYDYILEKVIQATQYHNCVHERWQQHLASISSETVLYKPRNYTNDIWATALSIDNFSSLPEHEVQPLFFASPVSGSEADDSRSWEWNADLFPKGIHFQKCIMIGLWRNLEVCGMVYNTVRLKLEAKTPEKRSVRVAVLVTGVQDNVEYVKKVVQRQCTFDKQTTMYNFNDIVPFEELNALHSSYLSGSDRNSFKITIIVKPV